MTIHHSFSSLYSYPRSKTPSICESNQFLISQYCASSRSTSDITFFDSERTSVMFQSLELSSYFIFLPCSLGSNFPMFSLESSQYLRSVECLELRDQRHSKYHDDHVPRIYDGLTQHLELSREELTVGSILRRKLLNARILLSRQFSPRR